MVIVIENFTKIEAGQASALEHSRIELIHLIASRFAHEIGNSLVPLATHAQLIDQKIESPAFQASLKAALLSETHRIQRFSKQMLYLSHEPVHGAGEIDLLRQIRTGFAHAKQHLQDLQTALALQHPGIDTAPVHGDPESLSYAFEELFLNALQVQETEHGHIHTVLERNAEGILHIRIRDNGPGFAADLIEHAPEPFFTTRNTGIGLGLAVAKKIIHTHRGVLNLNARSAEHNWDLQIELPALLPRHNHA